MNDSVQGDQRPQHTAIGVDRLVKRFGTFAAVDGLDLTVRTGEVYGFLGPNGAGKSTTIQVLLGLYRATAGRVRVLGLNPAVHAAEVTRRTSYVPGDVNLWPNLTGQEVLDALAGMRGTRDTAAERRLAADFALDTRKVARTYSKGNRWRPMDGPSDRPLAPLDEAGLAAALIHLTVSGAAFLLGLVGITRRDITTG